MIIATIALALQAAQPSPLLDPAFMAADDAWLECRSTYVSGLAGTRSARDVVAAAFAGCATQEAALRAILIARLGEAEGGRTMARIRDFSRQMMISRLR